MFNLNQHRYSVNVVLHNFSQLITPKHSIDHVLTDKNIAVTCNNINRYLLRSCTMVVSLYARYYRLRSGIAQSANPRHFSSHMYIFHPIYLMCQSWPKYERKVRNVSKTVRRNGFKEKPSAEYVAAYAVYANIVNAQAIYLGYVIMILIDDRAV